MNVSLCESCSFAKKIISGKGSQFLLCGKSQTDQRFPKYPRQPVMRCHGFVEKKAATTTRAMNQSQPCHAEEWWMKLKTSTGDMYFNPQLISHVHLSPDQSLLTVHFVNGTNLAVPAETDEERTLLADFLGQLADEQSGFIAIGPEMLNLKSALWVAIPEEGLIQVRSGDNRTHSLQDKDPERVRRVLGERSASA